MARDFAKNTAFYMTVGQNVIGPLLNGAAHLMIAAWINLDTISTLANHNRIVNIPIDAGVTGLTISVHNGTSAVLRVGCRSQSSDGFQTKDGTTVISTGTWHHVCGIVDIGGDTITPYLNGTAEGGGSVTFGAATYTDGTPTAGELDCIGGTLAGSVPATETQQIDGRIAEVGVWASATAFTAEDAAALSARFAPNLVRPDALKVYFRLLGADSPERDHWGGLSGTITGNIGPADHPNIIYPSSVISVQQAAAAPPAAVIGRGLTVSKALSRLSLVG